MEKLLKEKKKANNSNDFIELQEKNNTAHSLHFTAEQERKIIPKEIKNLKYILNSQNNMPKYSWEIDGENVY